MASSSTPAASPWPVVIMGALALAIAMGIGRFAFTPLMPLMLRDGTLDATTGNEWAAANYCGYLLGALTASWFAQDPRQGLRLGLVGVTLTTLAAAWVPVPFQLGGALLRAATGVLSAWVLVCASGWCLPELARRGSATLSGWIYIGVGLGITLAGLMAWLGGGQSARALWVELGLLATVGTLFVLFHLAGEPSATMHPGASPSRAAPGEARGQGALVLCYAAFGFGYIIPATYLPTMARRLVSDPLLFGLIWPIFGSAATLSVAMASRWATAWPRRRVWGFAQGLMAVGTALPLLHPSLWVLAGAALLVGGSFMVVTMAGLQLAREQMPAHPTPLLARMTAGFAVGQIAGPLLVRLLGTHQASAWDALSWASAAATTVLAGSAFWLWAGDGGGRNA